MWNVFNSRTPDSIFNKSFWSNKWLLLAIVSSIILQLVVIYTPLSQFFNTVALNAIDWLWVLAVSFSVVIAVEIFKFVKSKA